MIHKIVTEISTNKYDLSHRKCGYNVLTEIIDDITHDRIGLYCDICKKIWKIIPIECNTDNLHKNLKKAFSEKTDEQIKIMEEYL